MPSWVWVYAGVLAIVTTVLTTAFLMHVNRNRPPRPPIWFEWWMEWRDARARRWLLEGIAGESTTSEATNA